VDEYDGDAPGHRMVAEPLEARVEGVNPGTTTAAATCNHAGDTVDMGVGDASCGHP
jgi:hypothetical protein